jgi:hypothetical protein
MPTKETPTTEVPTTEALTKTTPTKTISTTNNDTNTKLLLYITCGLVALIVMILIIGCIYMVIAKNSRKSVNKQHPLTSISQQVQLRYV